MGPPVRRRVTIVTNDPEARRVVERVVREAGLEPFIASSGLKLLSVLHVDAPEAILLDLDVPWSDPVTLCTAMRNRPETATAPIVCFGSESTIGRIAACLSAGAIAHLAKPVDSSALFQQLESLGLLPPESRPEPEPS